MYTNVDPVLRQAIDTMPASDWLRVRIVGNKRKETEWIAYKSNIIHQECPIITIIAEHNANFEWMNNMDAIEQF